MRQNELLSGKKVIDVFLNNPIEKNMYELIRYSQIKGLADSDILFLAQGLANSGETISLGNRIRICDIPSTGGPSSLSTLICPLFLVNFGETVLKLGVPGRPAGGIDVLAQIKGYNISPNPNQLNSWIQRNRYVHFLANSNFTPLDAILFNFRKKNDAIAIPSLVIASLLSKKIAVGLNYVGLDIRVSDFGNFGKTWEQAKQNAYRFNKVASLAGIKSRCFLSNGNEPQQPYIGRGEAILALYQIFTKKAEATLENHTAQCFKTASSLCEKKTESFLSDSIRDIFFENILTQGGSKESFEEIAFSIEIGQRYFIESEQSGFLSINLEKLRDAIVSIQKKYTEYFSDPCGLILKVRHNEYVQKGDIICSFRCKADYLTEFEINLKTAFGFLTHPTIYKEFEEIS